MFLAMGRPMMPSPIIPTVCAMVDPRGGQICGGTASSPQGQVTQGAAGSQARTAQTPEKPRPRRPLAARGVLQMAPDPLPVELRDHPGSVRLLARPEPGFATRAVPVAQPHILPVAHDP